MFQKFTSIINLLLRKLHLKPVTVAGKCRLQFGIAVLLILMVALLIPYFWMNKLTQKAVLDMGRGIVNSAYESHFQVPENPAGALVMLEESGATKQDDARSTRWIRFGDQQNKEFAKLSPRQVEEIKKLQESKDKETTWVENSRGLQRYYVQVIRANDNCLVCHRDMGGAGPQLNNNQAVGAVLVKTPDREISKAKLMNQLCVIFAGAMAGTGALIALYVIVQRTILSPIRQLRALVNNVAEGNWDVRSAISTEDEYERLSEAFNHMLDNLQESQGKLRFANKQLDQKIVELSERNIQLFKANKLKSEFLANMSHEFRTPLNAILGFAEILKDKPADDIDKSKRYANNIVTSGRNLLTMINDLLDLAKAEAGKMTMHVEKTSVQQLCKGLAAFFANMTEEKRIKVKVDVQDDIPIIYTDSGKIQQILYNFFSNAIKFTPEEGRIKISAVMIDEKHVRISVEDTGCGIAKELQENIFEKFRQLDGSITRQGGGTGLGLAISKELASLLAANISLESELGKGSTFSLDLPVVESDNVNKLKEKFSNSENIQNNDRGMG